jgi:GTP:adenosylcobinamide-phosphate guanylyltransferase
VPIGGMTMVERVVMTLSSLSGRQCIVIACDQPETFATLPGLRTAIDASRLRLIGTSSTPSQTVLAAMHDGLVTPPFLITTADHPLLTAAMVREFWGRVPPEADVAAALAPAEIVRQAWPETRRTYLSFADGHYCSCNLFAIRTSRARQVLAFWQRMEACRKRPLSMIRQLGLMPTVRFLLGRLSLEAAVARLEVLTGARLAAVSLPFAEAAIDVDRLEDLHLAQRILQSR